MSQKSKKVSPHKDSIKKAADIVIAGGLIVFPWGNLERKCFAFMCDSKNVKACQRLNSIKTRSKNQVLAVNGYPELIQDIAKIEKSQPLMAAAKRLGIDPVKVLEMCMKAGAISFIFEARGHLPKTVTQKNGYKITVMVAGEIDYRSDFDFYTELVKYLHLKGITTAGSSANRTQEGTNYLFEQEKVFDDLIRDIDLFVYHDPLPKKPLYAINLESCTTFNMMVEGEYPEVFRFGSVHPDRFKKIFGNYTISDKAKYLPRHEKPLHKWIKIPLYLLSRRSI